MAHTLSIDEKSHAHEATLSDPRYQAYEILHWGFVAAPVLAGADKFTNLLTKWEDYLSPAFASLSPFSPHGTMLLVGVVEVVAGILVALKPRIGAYVVAAWLAGIILNLLLLGHFYDVALRDLGLCLGALALGRLSESYAREPSKSTHPAR
jgi:uncharacterized membrane protein YphA (DoxX/SURF4 family)